MLRKLLQPIVTLYAILSFVAMLLVLFPFFVVISSANNAGARRLLYNIIKGWARVWLFINGMPLRIVGKKPADGRYIIVANHISYLDTVVLFPALPGYFRALGKKEFSKVPLLGFLYRQIVIMVDRSSQQSRAKSMRLMWRVLRKESSIIIFPEGTFNETGERLKSFYDGAFRLAVNSQVPILPVIFPDTVHRWHYSAWWKIWPGKNRAEFLAPIDAKGTTTGDIARLKQETFDAMDRALARYDYP